MRRYKFVLADGEKEILWLNAFLISGVDCSVYMRALWSSLNGSVGVKMSGPRNRFDRTKRKMRLSNVPSSIDHRVERSSHLTLYNSYGVRLMYIIAVRKRNILAMAHYRDTH